MIRIFSVWMASSLVWLLASETLLLFGCYVAAAYMVLPIEAELYLLYEGGLTGIAVVIAIVLLGLHFHDLYGDARPRSALSVAQQMCPTLGVAILIQAVLAYGRFSLQLPRAIMFYGSAFALVAVPFWRWLYWSLVRKSLTTKQVLFVGTSPAALPVMERISERPELRSTVVGYLDSDSRSTGIISQAPFLGSLRELDSVVKQRHPDEIIVSVGGTDKFPTAGELLRLRLGGVDVEWANTVYETLLGRVSAVDLDPSEVIFWEGPQPLNTRLHYAYSFLFALTAMAAALPIMAVVAILLKLFSPGPVLFRQQRVGLNGKPFLLYKFRSMYVDAEAGTGPVWAKLDDPRITPLGRWLRKLHLDELPQLFNVMRGDMSLIGPRPERPEFVRMLAETIPLYKQRHCIKPGITGWAQINHRYGDTIADAAIKLEYDLYYIKHLTLTFDTLIILQTLKVALLQRGSR